MGERRRLVVVGAGIGGLTAAFAAAKAGYDIVIAERALALTEIGAGIQLSPNAGHVLAGLGLEPAIAAAAVEPKAIDVRQGPTGRLLTSLAGETFPARYGMPYQVIHRADLQSILVAAVRRQGSIDLRLGASVGEVLAKKDELFVKLSRGGGNEVVPASGIIGADGVWSSTRRRVTGAAEPRLVGRTAWRAVIPLDNLPPVIEPDRVTLWLGPDAHLVNYPIARGAAVNVVAIVEEAWDKPGWSAPGDRIVLAERFAGWSREVREIINAPFAWQKWAIAAVDPNRPWTAGSTVLLGDAAHAMPPFLAQGAAMAIEDAAVLAAALGRTGDVGAAFAAYEAERKPRVARVWKAAGRAGARYHYGPRLAPFRDLALGLFGQQLILGQNDWIYRWTGAPPSA